MLNVNTTTTTYIAIVSSSQIIGTRGIISRIRREDNGRMETTGGCKWETLKLELQILHAGSIEYMESLDSRSFMFRWEVPSTNLFYMNKYDQI